MSLFKKILKKPYIFYCKVNSVFCPKSRSKRLFKKMIGEKCNLENPSTLNEKLMYYKLNLYWENQLVNNCADKYKVRDFVKDKGLESILNPIYGSWDSPEEIEWDKLPNEFVLKLNFGSGFNLVCRDKSALDIKAVIKQFKKWMKVHYGIFTAEQGIYSLIDKKIIAEKYINTCDNNPPNDYKFFCSYGDVKFLFVATDRFEGQTKFDYYLPDWKWLDVRNCHPNKGPIEKPKNFDLMLKYASILSKQFPLVRVDFYNIEGQIIFGEMTFTHFGCVHPFDPKNFDLEFGKMLFDVKEASLIK